MLELKVVLEDLMIEVEIETITGGTAEFIRSLNDWFKDHGSLTEKQEKRLREIYDKHMG